MKQLSDEVVKAFERSVEVLSLTELSRRTGVRITTLRRFLLRRTRYVRQETFDKLYPAILPFIQIKPATANETTPGRIGSAPRMGHYLDPLSSDEKILLDAFISLTGDDQISELKKWRSFAGDVEAVHIAEISENERVLLGCFRAIAPDVREKSLLELSEKAAVEMRLRREEM